MKEQTEYIEKQRIMPYTQRQIDLLLEFVDYYLGEDCAINTDLEEIRALRDKIFGYMLRPNRDTCMVCKYRLGAECTLHDIKVRASTPACTQQVVAGAPF